MRPQVERAQCSLGGLLEFITVCCVLLAISPLIGVPVSAALMAMALALWMRIGWLALLLWMAAALFADIPWREQTVGAEAIQQVAAVPAVCGLVTWYYVRRKSTQERTATKRIQTGDGTSAALPVASKAPVC